MVVWVSGVSDDLIEISIDVSNVFLSDLSKIQNLDTSIISITKTSHFWHTMIINILLEHFVEHKRKVYF